MKGLNVAILDNCQIEIERTINAFHLIEIEDKLCQNFIFHKYINPNTFLNSITIFDLVCIEIDLKNNDGLLVIEKINKLKPKCKVVVITENLNRAIEGYKLDIHRYIIKPIGHLEFFEAIYSICEKLRKTSKIEVYGLKGEYFVDVNDISYFRVCDKESEVHLINDKAVMTKMSLKELEHQLPTDQFFRIHRSTVVNLNYVQKILKDAYTVEIKSNNKICLLDVSIRAMPKFSKSLIQYKNFLK